MCRSAARIFNMYFDDDDCFKVALASRHSGYPVCISAILNKGCESRERNISETGVF